MDRIWRPDSWRRCEARQQPDYDDPAALATAERELAAYAPLVGAGDIDELTAALAEAQAGRAFLLQGGDCAESFAEFSAETIDGNFALLGAIAGTLARASGIPIVRLGRIAGQFAKPRSAATETRGKVTLPAYRGDMINGLAFDSASRRADPERMFRAYAQAAATLNRLNGLAREAGAAFHSSHEALLLLFEQALTRFDAARGRHYATSAHFLWIGDRTRFPGSAHVEFARGIANPIGIKCGPSLEPGMLLRLLDILDPARMPGRITLIVRMGDERIAGSLPPLIRAVRREDRPVLWCCDPMHGNTLMTPGGHKTRPMSRILAEARSFFAVAAAEGIVPGGLHFEMTPQDVTECVGGGITEADVAERYQSHCDPRLNPAQAITLADLVAAKLAERAAAIR